MASSPEALAHVSASLPAADAANKPVLIKTTETTAANRFMEISSTAHHLILSSFKTSHRHTQCGPPHPPANGPRNVSFRPVGFQLVWSFGLFHSAKCLLITFHTTGVAVAEGAAPRRNR